MRRRAWIKGTLAFWLLWAFAPCATAQQASRKPQIGYVFPAGGQRGTTVEAVVGGQILGGANGALVSGTGIRASVVGYKRPLTIGEVNRLRERLEEARKKIDPTATGPLRPRDFLNLREIAREAGITDEQLRALEEFRRRRTDPKRQPNPQIEEEVRVSIEIGTDAEPGIHELRIVTPIGMTNPLRFVVGTLPEITEVEPNDGVADSSLGDRLPAVTNGQIMPGDVDRFSFRARKGTKLVAAVQARELIPYLADAVPGWFQAVLAIYDAKGRELAYQDDFQFRPDPLCRVVIPEDGEYTLVIRDSIYRGREDFVYRITLGEVPCITGMFPLGVAKGSRIPAKLLGWNLPSSTVMLDGNQDGVRTLRVEAAGAYSNEVTYRVDSLPEVSEKEPNDTIATAQKVEQPLIVNGQISKPGDRDVFRIAGHKGDRLVADVMARRLGSPADAQLVLTDSKGRQVAFNDDTEDKGAGLITHHADPYISVTLPADGVYFLRITDTEGKGGPEYSYRLRISAPKPDFELRVVPSGIWARAGMTVPVSVWAIRRDGFDGPIDLSLEGAPPGFVLSGNRIPAGLDRITITLSCAPTAQVGPLTLRMVGTATVGGRQIQHYAVPADEMMQAFAYTHLVPIDAWLVYVVGRAFARPPRPFSPDDPVRIPLGGSVAVRVPIPTGPFNRQMTLELEEAPAGVTLEKTDAATSTITIRCDPKNAKVGTRGNLILAGYMARQAAARAARQAPQRFLAGYVPAIPFEIVRP